MQDCDMVFLCICACFYCRSIHEESFLVCGSQLFWGGVAMWAPEVIVNYAWVCIQSVPLRNATKKSKFNTKQKKSRIEILLVGMSSIHWLVHVCKRTLLFVYALSARKLVYHLYARLIISPIENLCVIKISLI